MITSSINIDPRMMAQPHSPTAPSKSQVVPDDGTLRKTFDEFVGRTFFGQLVSSMRSTVGEPAYFHGGRAEEIFRGQLDQALAEEMSQSAAAEFTDPLYELFTLSRP